MQKPSAGKSGVKALIILGWLLYTASYLGKVNYAANITRIIDAYQITKAEAGMVPTFFFFSYGIGQVINGILCKRYNIRWTIFGSMLTSAAINFIIAISTDFTMIKWLWMVNGFVLSILWPTLIRLFAEALPQKDLGRTSVIMGTTVASGTLIIYGLSALYATFASFRLAFYTAAFVDMAVAVLWTVFYRKAVGMAKRAHAEEDGLGEEKAQEEAPQPKGEAKSFLATVYILCFCGIGANLIKDGLTTWVPSILKEAYSITDSLSILLTLFLPIVAIFGNLCALKLHYKIPDYVTHCAVVFGVIFAIVGVIIRCLTLQSAIVLLLGLVLANFLAASLNSLITSIFPMFMRGKVNSGLIAGVLNGFCYVGSASSSYGLGAIADHFGWTAVFWTLMGFCATACAIWGVYMILKRIWKEEKTA